MHVPEPWKLNGLDFKIFGYEYMPSNQSCYLPGQIPEDFWKWFVTTFFLESDWPKISQLVLGLRQD